MRQSPDHATMELALRKQVQQQIANHIVFTEKCNKLFHTLADVHSPESLKTLHSIPRDLRGSSKEMGNALGKWSECLRELTALFHQDGKQTAGRLTNTAGHRKEISGLRSKLADSRKQLAKREEQVQCLLNDGLRLALQKEELEKRLLMPMI